MKPQSANVTSGEGTPIIPKSFELVMNERRPTLLQSTLYKDLSTMKAEKNDSSNTFAAKLLSSVPKNGNQTNFMPALLEYGQ